MEEAKGEEGGGGKNTEGEGRAEGEGRLITTRGTIAFCA